MIRCSEATGEGKDTVNTNVDYELAAGQEIEVLVLNGIGDIDGTGNDFDNLITGNSGVNDIDGGAGNDTLNGGEGSDVLDGGKGNDVMNGGKGDDIYIVDNAGDKVTKRRARAHDAVSSFLASYTLGANLEISTWRASLTKGTGNAARQLSRRRRP